MGTSGAAHGEYLAFSMRAGPDGEHVAPEIAAVPALAGRDRDEIGLE
ncbi:hypothetical protein [Nocardia exalbida]|nr:hypothetical protein [Nocardia exalbida]